MSPPTLVLCWSIIIALCAARVDAADAAVAPGMRGVAIGTAGSPYGFAEYVPPRYATAATATFPLVITLHGMGTDGSGQDTTEIMAKVGGLGPLGLIKAGRTWFADAGAICVNPLAPWVWWNHDTMNTFVDALMRRYRVDADRVYINGCSMGGAGTTGYVQHYGERIAACMPDAVAFNPSPGDGATFATVPTWSFHAWGDTVCPLFPLETGQSAARAEPYPHGSSTILWMDEIAGHINGSKSRTTLIANYPNKGSATIAASETATANYSTAKGWTWVKGVDATSGPLAKFTIYAGGHHGWNPAYDSKPVWQWLFAQRRKAAPPAGAR
ncbi:MAG: hypothetical protein H0W72_16945 [Planctomycetes bacterium]|nr:hypothetical protein [Planctomycetota bacterium]